MRKHHSLFPEKKESVSAVFAKSSNDIIMGRGSWYSESSLWFNRKFYINGIKRNDSTEMGVDTIRMAENVMEEEQRLFSDLYAKYFFVGAWPMERIGAPLIYKNMMI